MRGTVGGRASGLAQSCLGNKFVEDFYGQGAVLGVCMQARARGSESMLATDLRAGPRRGLSYVIFPGNLAISLISQSCSISTMLSLFSATPSLNVGLAGAKSPRVATTMAEATKVTPLPASVKPGVVTGQALWDLLEHAKENKYAIPAVNVVSSCSIASCLEAAKSYGGPMIIQFSRGGGQFICGKTADNTDDAACIAGTVAVRASLNPNAALHSSAVRTAAVVAARDLQPSTVCQCPAPMCASHLL